MTPEAPGYPAADTMSVSSAADILDLSRSTILRRLRDEQWPGSRTGRKWLLPALFVEAVTALLNGGARISIEDYAAVWLADPAAATAAAREALPAGPGAITDLLSGR